MFHFLFFIKFLLFHFFHLFFFQLPLPLPLLSSSSSFSDFCTSPFLLFWARVCVWLAFLQLCLISLVIGKLPASASALSCHHKCWDFNNIICGSPYINKAFFKLVALNFWEILCSSLFRLSNFFFLQKQPRQLIKGHTNFFKQEWMK